MTAREVLIEARRLIAEKGWTQGEFARGFGGRSIEFDSVFAECFCMYGAIMLASKQSLDPLKTAHRMLTVATKVDPLTGLGVWNDTPGRTKDEVLAAFDRAIELAGAP